jgi:hypothetical protein
MADASTLPWRDDDVARLWAEWSELFLATQQARRRYEEAMAGGADLARLVRFQMARGWTEEVARERALQWIEVNQRLQLKPEYGGPDGSGEG